MTLAQGKLASTRRAFAVSDYDLAATLSSGQAFRWQQEKDGWVGVVENRWVRLIPGRTEILAETAETIEDWDWLSHYLQLHVDLEKVIATFPEDSALRLALGACRGLRLLRPDPWECTASFICSSNKQIVQIRQIVGLLCEKYGDPVAVPGGQAQKHSFPTASRIAQLQESDLVACKMGFRAKYLLEAAKRVARGCPALTSLGQMGVTAARDILMELPGVGRKIADCVLLFAYGFQDSFPVDVWVAKALRQLYFQRRQVKLSELHAFANAHFGTHAGYAQQYLFHYMRTHADPGTLAISYDEP